MMKSLLIVLFLAGYAVHAQEFIRAEYFFDADPGAGNGTAISLGAAGDPMTINASIPVGTLAAGFHVLGFRVQQNDNSWSAFESRGFYISRTTTDAPVISAAEYFFDADPGIGNGNTIAITPGNATNFTIPVPATGVAPGFHFLAIRTMDANGKWGLFETRGFFVSAATQDAFDIVAAEYFFDNDPGTGEGTGIPVNPGGTSNFNILIPATGLTAGFHYLAIRTRSQDGKWGLFESRGFYVSAQTTDASDIVEAEYFFDADPGPENGTSLSIPGGATSVFTVPVPATSLSPGFHFLTIRTKSADGKWSLFESRGFYVTAAPGDVGPIVAAEYFFDNEPGEGSGVALPVTASDTVSAAFMISVPDTLSTGVHHLFVRVQSSDGNWSIAQADQFTIVDNLAPVAHAGPDQNITLPSDSVTLSASASADDGAITAFSWIQLTGPSASNIQQPGAETTTVYALTEGVYEFELTVTDDEGASDKDTVVVTVHPAPNQIPVADAGVDNSTVLPADSVTLDGTGSSDDGILSFTWTMLSGPSAVTIVTEDEAMTVVRGLVEGVYDFELTVADEFDESDKDTVRVTVNAPPNQKPVANAGADQEITLPRDSVRVDAGSSADADGTIIEYLWTRIAGPSMGTIATASAALTDITALQEGTYLFSVIVTDNDGATDTDTLAIVVRPDPCPPLPEITQTGNALVCDQDGVLYQWFMNDVAIAGATGKSIEVTVYEYALYAVEVSANGCTVRSGDFVYLVTGGEGLDTGVRTYPNPFQSRLTIEVPPGYADRHIVLLSLSGRAAISRTMSASMQELDTSDLAAGMYFLLIDGVAILKIVKN